MEAWRAFCVAADWWKKNKRIMFENDIDDFNEVETILIDVIKHIGYMWYI
jgi:hypothetical protein